MPHPASKPRRLWDARGPKSLEFVLWSVLVPQPRRLLALRPWTRLNMENAAINATMPGSGRIQSICKVTASK